ncbi:MAG TPA: hypothetical protein VGE51_08980 [Fontimonas sp.]
MEKETLNLKKKLVYVFQHLDALYLFRNEIVRDHGKRAIQRFFFVQIDNLLKLAPQLKNRLAAEGSLSATDKVAVELAIGTLRGSYDGSFDSVRDKLAAHAQIMDLGTALAWWDSIDYSTIDVLYDDVERVERTLRTSRDMDFARIGTDYRPLDVPSDNDLSPDSEKFHVDSGRLGLSSAGAVSLIVLAPEHKKAQLVVSTLDMIRFDFALTCLVENYSTRYRELLFDAGWLLALMDTCSLIDNLFDDSPIDGPSLLDQWEAIGLKGHAVLRDMDLRRDAVLEEEIRRLRNKFAAHIDADAEFEDLHAAFVRFDLARVVAYVHWLANGFLSACRVDIRTRMFAVHGSLLAGVLDLMKTVKPFDDC